MRSLMALFRNAVGSLALSVASMAFAQNPAVTVNVDANANRHPISPFVYGVAYGSAAALSDLNSPLNRYGGNNSVALQLAAERRQPRFRLVFRKHRRRERRRRRARRYVHLDSSKGAGAQSMITIPMLDWVAKLGTNRSESSRASPRRSTARRHGNDWQWYPDAGNGVRTSTGANITGNDPNDANVPNSTSLQQGWVQHIVIDLGHGIGRAACSYYILDNEHSIWHSTHRDVHPAGATMDEIRQQDDRITPTHDQDCRPVGAGRRPRRMGLERILYQRLRSAVRRRAQLVLLSRPRQRTATGPYLPWLLDQMHQNEARRPASACSTYSPCITIRRAASSATTRRRRCSCCATSRRARSGIRTTSIATWINDKVHADSAHHELGRRVLSRHCRRRSPNTTGARKATSTARRRRPTSTASSAARVSTSATRWTTPDPSDADVQGDEDVSQLRRQQVDVRRYQRVGSRAESGQSCRRLRRYARNDGAMTVMVISKVLSGSTPVTVNLANFVGERRRASVAAHLGQRNRAIARTWASAARA